MAPKIRGVAHSQGCRVERSSRLGIRLWLRLPRRGGAPDIWRSGARAGLQRAARPARRGGEGWGGGGGGSWRLLGPLVATAPQFTLGSRAASMTDALLPAAPQPLEKESDDYFRKVGGEPADPLCPLKLCSALMGLAAGVGLARSGRRREGDARGRAGLVRASRRGREGERGLRGAERPEQMAGSWARAHRCTGEPRAGRSPEK